VLLAMTFCTFCKRFHQQRTGELLDLRLDRWTVAPRVHAHRSDSLGRESRGAHVRAEASMIDANRKTPCRVGQPESSPSGDGDCARIRE
jgi:hypothetical protein